MQCIINKEKRLERPLYYNIIIISSTIKAVTQAIKAITQAIKAITVKFLSFNATIKETINPAIAEYIVPADIKKQEMSSQLRLYMVCNKEMN